MAKKAVAKKTAVKGFKQTEKDKYFRGETNQTADTARAGNLARVASRAAAKPKAKRPTGELPKRMSGFARVIAQDYPELGKSGAAARAGKIRDEFASSTAAAKKAQAKRAAAKKAGK